MTLLLQTFEMFEIESRKTMFFPCSNLPSPPVRHFDCRHRSRAASVSPGKAGFGPTKRKSGFGAKDAPLGHPLWSFPPFFRF